MQRNSCIMLNKEKNRELDNLASEIDKRHNDNTKIYQAVKFITGKPLQYLMVHENASRNITEPNVVYNIADLQLPVVKRY